MPASSHRIFELEPTLAGVHNNVLCMGIAPCIQHPADVHTVKYSLEGILGGRLWNLQGVGIGWENRCYPELHMPNGAESGLQLEILEGPPVNLKLFPPTSLTLTSSTYFYIAQADSFINRKLGRSFTLTAKLVPSKVEIQRLCSRRPIGFFGH